MSTHEEDIQAMLDDPGHEAGERDHPDFIDTRKEVSPWDYDPPFDEFDATYANPYYGDGDEF